MPMNENHLSPPVVDFLPGDACRPENPHRVPSFQQSAKPAASVSLSLRTRETCAQELKKIFDQISRNVEKKELKDSPGKGVADSTGLASAKNPPFSPCQTRSASEKISDSTGRHAQQGFLPWAVSGSNVCNSTRQPAAQLTIFYSGTVNIYDDVPADKANAIMLLAGAANSCIVKPTNEEGKDVATTPLNPSTGTSAFVPLSRGGPTIPVNSTVLPNSESNFNKLSAPSMVPSTAVNSVYKPHSSLQSPTLPIDAKTQARRPHSGTELPYARKASLARFLEKRKDRVQVPPEVNATAQCDGEKDVMGTEEKERSPKRLAVKCKETDGGNCCDILTSTEHKAPDTLKNYRFLDG